MAYWCRMREWPILMKPLTLTFIIPFPFPHWSRSRSSRRSPRQRCFSAEAKSTRPLPRGAKEEMLLFLDDFREFWNILDGFCMMLYDLSTSLDDFRWWMLLWKWGFQQIWATKPEFRPQQQLSLEWGDADCTAEYGNLRIPQSTKMEVALMTMGAVVG